MSADVLIQPQPSNRWRVASRVGLVLASIMAVFNTINGIGSLIDPSFGQVDPTVAAQPAWMSIALIVFGTVTLAAIVPAWRTNRTAIWVVVVSRLAEAWSAIVLPFLPGAPDGIAVFAVILIVVGTAISGLVALGLRQPS